MVTTTLEAFHDPSDTKLRRHISVDIAIAHHYPTNCRPVYVFWGTTSAKFVIGVINGGSGSRLRIFSIDSETMSEELECDQSNEVELQS